MNQYNSIDPYGNYDVKGLSPYEMAMRMASWHEELRSTISEVDLSVGAMETQIIQNSKEIINRVTYEDFTGEAVTSLIVQDAYSINLLANQLNIRGFVTITDLSGYGTTIINGANIMTGTILADRLAVTELSAIVANLGTVTAGELRGVTVTGSNMTMRNGNLMWDEGIPAYYAYIRATTGAMYINASQSVNVSGRLNALSGLTVAGTIDLGGNTVYGAGVFNGGNMAFIGSSISFNGVTTITGVPKSTTSGLEFGYASGTNELVVRISGSERGRVKLT